MAKFDPMAILMFIIRMVPAIVFIFVMVMMFFSFRVDVRDESMQRVVLEISDALASSPLTDHNSIFNMEKLSQAEAVDPNRNVELYAVNCDFGYYLDIESLAGQTPCSRGTDCVDFCKTTCGLDDSNIDMSMAGTLTGNCGCNIELFSDNFCQCKKNDEWQDGYKWSYGYKPGYKRMAGPSAEFPVGIAVGETVLPAKMTITAYDSFLARISCAVKKAYQLKTNFTMNFDTTYVTRNSVFKRTDPDGTHVCLYYRDEPYECRYLPNATFLEFQFTPPATANKGTITAYPLKTSFATCDDIKSPGFVAGKDDTVIAVLLCLEGTP